MSSDLNISRLEFGSLLSYLPRVDPRSRTVMLAIKSDKNLAKPPILMSHFISHRIKENIGSLPFSDYFDTKPILVPVPNSSLMKAYTLWVPQRLANALHENGLGRGVEDVLRRWKPLPKASLSLPEDRPKAIEHYDSLEVRKKLIDPKDILLIDDIVTRGATLLWSANKLSDIFPGVRIRAFAAMRTISQPGQFRRIYDPCVGDIRLIGEETSRNP